MSSETSRLPPTALEPNLRGPLRRRFGEVASLLSDSLRGRPFDLTSGSIRRSLLLLALPMALESSLEASFALVDLFWVSRLGFVQVAALGLTEALMTIVLTIAIGISIATTAVVARSAGQRDSEAVARASVQAALIAGGVGAVLSVVGAFSAPSLLRAMGGSAELVALGGSYARVVLAGSITIVVSLALSAALRAVGDAATAMRALLVGNLINAVLAPCLIFGVGPFPELGLTGAAIATTCARGLGVVYQLHALLRGRSFLRVAARQLRPDRTLLQQLGGIAALATLQVLVGMAAWVALARIAAGLGEAAIAAHTLVLRCFLLAIFPCWGIANAAATLAGQNLAAGKAARVEQAVYRAGHYNALFLGLVAVPLLVFADPIVGWFSDDLRVEASAAFGLRTIAIGLVFYGYAMVFTSALNGMGDTRTPTWIHVCCLWLFEIPLGYLLAVSFGYGIKGLFVAMLLGMASLAVVAAIAFARGRSGRAHGALAASLLSETGSVPC